MAAVAVAAASLSPEAEKLFKLQEKVADLDQIRSESAFCRVMWTDLLFILFCLDACSQIRLDSKSLAVRTKRSDSSASLRDT